MPVAVGRDGCRMSEPQFPQRPFWAAEAKRLGISAKQIERAVAAGKLRRVFRGVYVPTHLEDTIALRAVAIALVIADHNVVVDRTAAWLHGVDCVTWAEHAVLPPVETCALRGRRRTDLTGADGRERDLAAQDIQTIDGVRVTTPLRTALDLGCNLRRREAYAAMNALARRHHLTAAMLAIELPRFRGRRGVVQLRELIPLVDPRLESERESWTLLEIHDAGLPLPTPQHWIVIDGVPTYRLDLAYPELRVCVEYDGFDAHARTPEQVAHDEARREWLRCNDWTVIVVRNGDFTGERVERWIRELAEALVPSYTNRRW